MFGTRSRSIRAQEQGNDPNLNNSHGLISAHYSPPKCVFPAAANLNLYSLDYIMPPSRSPSITSKAKTTPTMKQGKLNFSVKRTNSAGSGVEKKGKPKPSPSKAPIVLEDSDEDEKVVLEVKTEKLSPSAEESVLKKRKLDDDDASEPKDGRKRKAIFKSRTSLENSSGDNAPSTEEQEPRPKLDVKDKRWQRAYTQAKTKTGGAKPGTFTFWCFTTSY